MAVRVKRICKNVGIVIFVVAVSTVLLTYLFYRDFRKALASALSGRASAAIGQHVDIGDISISLSRGIDIDDLQVRNPDGFAMGRLLAVKKISLYPDYGAFLNGDIRFRKILISSPALTIVKDNQGRTNISAGLRRFFSQKKGKTPYRIDEIALSSGSIDIGGDPLARNEEISLALRDLSSEPAEKAFFQGTTLWEGGSRIRIEGWVYPGDEPKRFFLSLSAADLKFAPFREILQFAVSTRKN